MDFSPVKVTRCHARRCAGRAAEKSAGAKVAPELSGAECLRELVVLVREQNALLRQIAVRPSAADQERLLNRKEAIHFLRRVPKPGEVVPGLRRLSNKEWQFHTPTFVEVMFRRGL